MPLKARLVAVGAVPGRVEAGMQFLHTVLRPGESIRSPRILQVRWQGGDQYRAYNLFRRTMLAHIVPRVDGEVVVPPIAHLSTSFYELNDSNEQNVLAHLASTQELGFEVFWLDAYWTGPTGFPQSMGNYGFPIERIEPRDRFPNGLRVIGDAVEKAGQKFLMWFEPERVVAGTFLAKEHPDWLFSPGDNQIAGVGDGFQRHSPAWIETVKSLHPDFPVYGSIIEASECLTRLIGQENAMIWMAEYPERMGAVIDRAAFVACHQFEFIDKIDVLEHAAEGASFLLNAPGPAGEAWASLPVEMQRQMIDKKIRFHEIGRAHV